MARRKTDSTVLIASVMVAVAVLTGEGMAHRLDPLVGPVLAWSIGILLPTYVAYALMHRMGRTIMGMDKIVAEAHGLLLRVHGPGGEHILRVDRAGMIAADVGAEYGNPVRLEPGIIGHRLADLCDEKGFLTQSAGAGVRSRKFAVREVPQGTGTLVFLREFSSGQQEAGHVAMIDALTELPNRQAFLHTLETSCAIGQPGFVVIFDIDRLRAINDRHGNVTGDKVLQSFAADAAELVRSDDSLARISGGSFAVLLSTPDVVRAEKVASRLIAKFGGAARTAGDAIVRATASAGIAPLRDTAAETIRDAERALLIAKARNHDRFEVAGATRRSA